MLHARAGRGLPTVKIRVSTGFNAVLDPSRSVSERNLISRMHNIADRNFFDWYWAVRGHYRRSRDEAGTPRVGLKVVDRAPRISTELGELAHQLKGNSWAHVLANDVAEVVGTALRCSSYRVHCTLSGKLR